MKQNINQKIGLIIKLERTKRGLTQEKLAEKSNLNVRSIGVIERGQSSPSIETLERIAKALNIKLTRLVDIKNLEK